MASSLLTSCCFSLPVLSFSSSSRLSPPKSLLSLRTRSPNTLLSSSKSLSLLEPLTLPKTITSPSHSPSRFSVFAAKGYKMKTHKASAKRFRVTGKGKIVRRRAGKQHLLAKKNTKRKLRLSKMIGVDRSDYDNVIGALPYLKVNRKAT
ncbi:50S ribosomal protein L35, chloroplastic [Iris pallida]|uniref:50S ribosomal protein L35 n=1 Tax=Iris pallida TaxID=29817 RepID=A0AAX6GST0_IRIPA|nr:50S ribosomal protein L35, chloroplastic [Iris pallida]